jgi:hypothetical protein
VIIDGLTDPIKYIAWALLLSFASTIIAGLHSSFEDLWTIYTIAS